MCFILNASTEPIEPRGKCWAPSQPSLAPTATSLLPSHPRKKSPLASALRFTPCPAVAFASAPASGPQIWYLFQSLWGSMLESHAHCPTLPDGEETMRNPMGAPVSWVTLTSPLPSCPEAPLGFWIGAFILLTWVPPVVSRELTGQDDRGMLIIIFKHVHFQKEYKYHKLTLPNREKWFWSFKKVPHLEWFLCPTSSWLLVQPGGATGRGSGLR